MSEDITDYPIVKIDPYVIERPESDPRYQFQRMFFSEETAPPDLWTAAMAAKEVPSGSGGPGGVTKRFRWRRGERPTNARGFEPWQLYNTRNNYAEKFLVRVEESDDREAHIKRSEAEERFTPTATLADYDIALRTYDAVLRNMPWAKEELERDVRMGDVFDDINSYPWFYASEPAFDFIRERAEDEIVWKRVLLPQPAKNGHDLFAIEVMPYPVIDWFNSEVVWQYVNAGYGRDAHLSAELIGEPCFHAGASEGRMFLRDSYSLASNRWQFIENSFVGELAKRFDVLLHQHPSGILHSDIPKIYYGEED